MEVRPRQELFRKYVRWVEGRLQAQEDEQDEDGLGGRPGEEELLAEAGALLVSPPSEPSQRFRLIPFYEVVENALHTLRDSGLRALETAFATLETVCVNLLLFPWKKEFRCIKTFTGPYVYLLKAALCDSDLRSLLRSMGYTQDEDLQLRAGAPPGGMPRLRQLAFELFLARAECRLIVDAVLRAGEGATEAGALEARRGARDERDRERGRACARRSVRSSRSVDVADGAGSWQPAVRPVLRATLSLRKDPCCQESEEGPAGDCPQTAMAPLCPTRFLAQTPPTEPPEPLAYQLDEPDLYADRAVLRQAPTPPPRPPARDLWGPRGQGIKCQGCARWCPGSVACPQSTRKLCPACCADAAPRPFPRALDTHVLAAAAAAAEKLPVYPGAQGHPQWLQKPLTAPKPLASKLAMAAGGSRCGFCDRPGASHTCLSCSKVSCGPCTTLYCRDVCGRKNAHHSFAPNQQLSYKCGVLSHPVHR